MLPVAIPCLPHTADTSFRHFIAPSTLVVLPSWDAGRVLDCISKYHVTGMAVVPSLVFQLLAHPKLRSKETDLSSLTGVGTGAAYLPPAVSLLISFRIANKRTHSNVIQTEKEFLDVLEAKGSKGTKLQRFSSGYGLSESVCFTRIYLPSHSDRRL